MSNILALGIHVLDDVCGQSLTTRDLMKLIKYSREFLRMRMSLETPLIQSLTKEIKVSPLCCVQMTVNVAYPPPPPPVAPLHPIINKRFTWRMIMNSNPQTICTIIIKYTQSQNIANFATCPS